MGSYHPPADADDAFEQWLELQERALSLARHYAAVLYDWHEPAAIAFRDSVLRPINGADYNDALRGLDAFLKVWYDTDPLLREYCCGINTMLRLVLIGLISHIEVGD